MAKSRQYSYGIAVAIVFSSTIAAATVQPGDIVFSGWNDYEISLGVVDPATGSVQSLANYGTPEAEFGAIGVAIDGAGNIITVSSENPNLFGVVRFDPNTDVTTTISSGSLLTDPWGVIIDATGEIIVPQDYSIIGIDPATGAQSVIASGGFLEQPMGMVINGSGNIIVADNSLSCGTPIGILSIDPQNGAQSIVSSGGLLNGCILGIAEETSGDLLVTQATYGSTPGMVIQVDPSTGIQEIVSSGGLLQAPYGIAIGPTGQLYIADWFSGIFSVDPSDGARTFIANPGTDAQLTGLTVVPESSESSAPEPSSLLLLSFGFLIACCRILVGIFLSYMARISAGQTGQATLFH